MEMKDKKQNNVRVLKDNYNKKRCVCENCKSILEYSEDSLEREKICMNEYRYVIICPACGKYTGVKSVVKNVDYM